MERKYRLPENVIYPKPQQIVEIGDVGKRYKSYLQRHHYELYFSMKLLGSLNTYLAYMDEEFAEKYEEFLSVIKVKEGITETLKETDPLTWEKKLRVAKKKAEVQTLLEFSWLDQ